MERVLIAIRARFLIDNLCDRAGPALDNWRPCSLCLRVDPITEGMGVCTRKIFEILVCCRSVLEHLTLQACCVNLCVLRGWTLEDAESAPAGFGAEPRPPHAFIYCTVPVSYTHLTLPTKRIV